ncbi:hypothetical protein K456DRAFT_58659 [Colletotrichum gloeosporioides 23]|nr:hypothetical protein K456DRAFT_58659 [Colletotrichum gloeosporioides 23]
MQPDIVYFQLTFTANYLLSLRLITLASEDLIYYSLRPTTQTTTPVYCYNVLIPNFC